MGTINTIKWVLVNKGTDILSKVGSSGRPATFSRFKGLLKWYDPIRHDVLEVSTTRLVPSDDTWVRDE